MTTQERIAKYLEAIPPAIAYSRGHDQTFKVACFLYNGWALTEAETLALLKVYNANCQPRWSDKELQHKAADAARAEHKKPRGHLLNASTQEHRAEPDWTLPTKPIASGKIPATLATLNSNLRVRAYNANRQPRGYSPFHAYARSSEINVANVAQREHLALVGPKTAQKHAPEDIHRFIDEVVIREPGALCAFHYLFACYRKWRASFGLLATNLTQEQFAFAVQSHGIKVDFDRKLFFDACARWEHPGKSAPDPENTGS